MFLILRVQPFEIEINFNIIQKTLNAKSQTYFTPFSSVRNKNFEIELNVRKEILMKNGYPNH